MTTPMLLRSSVTWCCLSLVLALAAAGCGGGSDEQLVNGSGQAIASVQVDRMGIPAVNTAIIPPEQKDAFNLGDPSSDAATFRTTATVHIAQLRAAVNNVPGFPPEDVPGLSAATVAGALIPDVITIDLSKPVAFPNGRRLTDDVIDAALGLVLNRGNPLGGGPGVSDGVANDSVFLSTFPYLGTPK